MTYPSTLKIVGIGFGFFFFFLVLMTYLSAFESAGIGLLNFIHSWPIPALLEVLAQVEKRWYRLYSHFHKGCPDKSKNIRTGSESAGTYPSAFEKHWYRSAWPYPHIQKPAVWSTGKKNAEIGILTLSQHFLGLSQRFWKCWDSPIFL